MYTDPTGLAPYSKKNSNGQFTLYVSPQWVDAGGSGAGIGLDLLNPIAGAVYSSCVWAGMRINGYRSIGYNAGDLAGIAAGLVEGFSNNAFLKGAGRWTGNALSGFEVLGYLNDWFGTHQYQVEEAVYNHFNSGVWTSSSRRIVDNKFECAMQNMTRLIFEGKIEVRKAGDVFSKDSFWTESGMTMTRQYDPLTGSNRIFRQDEYYFFMINDSAKDIVSAMETIIRNITR